jgi:hypothetical protein
MLASGIIDSDSDGPGQVSENEVSAEGNHVGVEGTQRCRGHRFETREGWIDTQARNSTPVIPGPYPNLGTGTNNSICTLGEVQPDREQTLFPRQSHRSADAFSPLSAVRRVLDL